MPPKNCGACQKMVYPMDELKCLDKTWHKACFRCQVCSMTLNMKNYKGYNKLPYCNAHYPTTKFTSVAETPENMRIKKNTAIQSNIKYHEEFEAAKGQYTAVADDPETARVRKNMTTISNVAYHGELAKKQEMENARPAEIDASTRRVSAPTPRVRQPGSVSDYDPAVENQLSPSSNKPQSTTCFSSSNSQKQAYSRSRRIGSITDYDPINDNYGSIVDQYPAPAPRQVPTSPPAQSRPAPQFTQPPPVAAPRHTSPARAPAPAMSPPPVRDPSPPPVRDPSPPPVRNPSPPPVRNPSPPPVRNPSPPPVRDPSPPPVRDPSPPPVRDPSPPPVRDPSPPPVRAPSFSSDTTTNPQASESKPDKGLVSKALYDYTAADDDEVGFDENDTIIQCEEIDDGWMYGTVERTGLRGMLPSNYVEKVNW